jgi:hypothetical protein
MTGLGDLVPPEMQKKALRKVFDRGHDAVQQRENQGIRVGCEPRAEPNDNWNFDFRGPADLADC